MKKFTYLYLASALILCNACQDERFSIEDSNRLSFSVMYEPDAQSAPQTKSTVEFTDENGNPSPFNITLSVEDSQVDSPKTKGTPIHDMTDFNNIVKEFRAWGYYNGTAWTNVDGSKVKQFAGSDYRPVDGSDHEINAYQPGATDLSKYRFYAIYPYEISELSTRGATVSGNSSAGYTISYTSPGSDNSTNTDDAIRQKEVLAGYMTSTTSMAKIPVTFKPILAEIRFKVSTKQLGRDVTINSIELHTLSATGTCTVSNTGVSWSNLGEQNVTFTQAYNYDIDHNDGSGQEINDNDLTKTFFIIPQKGKAEVTAGKPTGTRIVIKYCEKDSSVEEEAKHLLFGQEFEAGKTYIYNIGDFKGDSVKMEPWVEFSEFDVNDNNLIAGENLIHEENNSKFVFDFTQRNGTYEKAYFKIHNLVVDHWYSIEFTENLSLKGYTTTPFGTPGTYACRVHASMNKSTAQNSMIVFHDGAAANYDRSDTDDNPPFVWQHPDNKNSSTTYTSLLSKGETAKITFKATATMMYWVWDFSKGYDGRTLRSEIYMPRAGQTITCNKYDGTTEDITFTTGEKIKDITPEPNVPTVDFLNATLYNVYRTGNNYGNSSNKSYAVDATAGALPVKGTLEFRVRSAAQYARMNIPLTNLNLAKTYRIRYTLDKTGTAGRNGTAFHVGCIIRDSPNIKSGTNAANDAFNYSDPNYHDYTSDYSCTDADFTIDGSASGQPDGETIEFTPTASTMYWVWDFSKFNNGNTDHQFLTFSNVTIEELEP